MLVAEGRPPPPPAAAAAAAMEAAARGHFRGSRRAELATPRPILVLKLFAAMDPSTMTVADLKKELGRRGLSQAGLKADLQRCVGRR